MACPLSHLTVTALPKGEPKAKPQGKASPFGRGGREADGEGEAAKNKTNKQGEHKL